MSTCELWHEILNVCMYNCIPFSGSCIDITQKENISYISAYVVSVYTLQFMYMQVWPYCYAGS